MASGWVKSLQCKSRALEDVYHQPSHNSKVLPSFLPSSGCRKSVRSLKDVVHKKSSSKKRPHHRSPPPSSPSLPRPRHSFSSPAPAPSSSFFPALTELPPGHSSRNVVEIIFHTSWSETASPASIEMIFKVQNPACTVARFEEYREAVKSRAAADGASARREADARCLADGNEVMRFHFVGPAGCGGRDASGLCTFSGKGAAIRTFSGSGGAHESAGGGKGRRAMVVCRVVAGRVCRGVESFLEGVVGGFDSVSGENESLVVFDSRALLPCFLIIYKV